MCRGGLSSALLAVILAMPVAGHAAVAVPVRQGGDAVQDACGTLATVTGLDPHGDNFLSVRSGPGGTYREVDRLHQARQVWICEQKGAWLGIVYRGSANGADCAVGTPRAKAGPYRGPCRSGWVHRRHVRVIAG